MSITCELLIQAKPSTVFAQYAEPFHWNMQFSGIHQAWLEQKLAKNAQGAIAFHKGKRWKMKIVEVYDDTMLVVRVRRALLQITFTLAIRPLQNNSCRVRHQLDGNILSYGLFLFYKKQLQHWLHTNLLLVQNVCVQTQQSQKTVVRTTAKKRTSPQKKRNNTTKKSTSYSIYNSQHCIDTKKTNSTK